MRRTKGRDTEDGSVRARTSAHDGVAARSWLGQESRGATHGASRTRLTIGPIRSSAKHLIPRRWIATRSTACVRGRTNGGLSDDGAARHGGDRTRGGEATHHTLDCQTEDCQTELCQTDDCREKRTKRTDHTRGGQSIHHARRAGQRMAPRALRLRPCPPPLHLRSFPHTGERPRERPATAAIGAVPVVPGPTRRIATCATACGREDERTRHGG